MIPQRHDIFQRQITGKLYKMAIRK